VAAGTGDQALPDHLAVLLPMTEDVTPEFLESITEGWRVEAKRGWFGGLKTVLARRGNRTIKIKGITLSRTRDTLWGFKRYIAGVSEGRPEEVVKEALGRLDGMRQILRITVEPGFDPEGECRGFIVRVARRFEGMIFEQGALYDGSGRMLAGPEESPASYPSA
jgi:hypothetical protein